MSTDGFGVGVGDGIAARTGSWSFGGHAAAAFDEHVTRSIPFYAAGHDIVTGVADVLLGPGMLLYDLGCSTGALAEQLAHRVGARGVTIVGVDSERDMLDRAHARCGASVGFVEADLASFVFEPCDLVVAYYTMQFVARDERDAVVRRIYDALRPGGAFLCFDKVFASDARTQELAVAVYHDWKRAQGFDDAEIANKGRSLRGLLRPLTSTEERDMFHRAGFADVDTIFKWVCWEGFLARK